MRRCATLLDVPCDVCDASGTQVSKACDIEKKDDLCRDDPQGHSAQGSDPVQVVPVLVPVPVFWLSLLGAKFIEHVLMGLRL